MAINQKAKKMVLFKFILNNFDTYIVLCLLLLVDLTTWLDKNKLTKILSDHEYHEISDEDAVAESPRFEVSLIHLYFLT